MSKIVNLAEYRRLKDKETIDTVVQRLLEIHRQEKKLKQQKDELTAIYNKGIK